MPKKKQTKKLEPQVFEFHDKANDTYIYKIGTEGMKGDPKELMELAKTTFDSKKMAESAWKINMLTGRLLDEVKGIQPEALRWLAAATLDNPVLMKVAFTMIENFYDDNIEEPEWTGYAFEMLEINTRTHGAAEVLLDLMTVEGKRDFAKDRDFFKQAFEAIERGTKPEEEEVIEDTIEEPVTDEVDK